MTTVDRDGPAAAPATGPARRRLAFAALFATQLVVMVEGTIVNVSLTVIRDVYGLAEEQLSWVFIGFAIGFGAVMLVGGRLSDAIGARRALVGAVALFAAASLLCGLADGPWTLLTGRVLQGVGGAAAIPAVLATVADLSPDPAARRRAVATLMASSLVGAGLGLTAGGLVAELMGARWVFLINVPLCLLLLPCLWALPERPADRAATGPLATGQAFLLTTSLAALLLGLTLITAARLPGAAVLTLGVVGAALTVRATRRAGDRALVPVSLLADRGRRAGYLVVAVTAGGSHAAFYHLQLMVQRDFGLGPAATGLWFTPVILAMIGATVLSGRLLRRLPDRTVVVAGCLVSTAGLVWVAVDGGASGPHPLLVVPMAMLAAGSALCIVPLSVRAVAGVPPGRTGVASAVLTSSQQVGGAALLSGTTLLAAALAGVPARTTAVVALALVTAFAAVVALRGLAPPDPAPPPEPPPPPLPGGHP